ncbi:dihydropyrimidine dehydrogenase [Halogeometricum pallidum JCM 14848]|uniref:Dihydropyrimidine dehydrogenase n=1 Tax=Halogeometricum pallidum JCM 14848 TaxID=1227487 RepID=M0DK62_HALPD|nr:tRNA-dihydrouridine synthase [Halogeometricum pallidum]ELZ35087.1 dihydropyrimidine dehydrogenase [Halogeometricum pallidum JCM 14848]
MVESEPEFEFEPRVALASLSGESDAAWARAAAPHAGMAFLGGIALDAESRAAARDLVARDRTEFLPDDPLAFVAGELDALAETDLRVGVNVRSATVEPVREAAAVCADRGAVLEVNAHCRQEELRAVGCGESLLRDTDRLCEYVAAAADEGATVSAKVRAEVDGVDLAETAERLAGAGASTIHVDAMDSKAVVAEVSEAPLFVVANNEVRGEESVREYLDYGADAVSVGRPSTDPRVLRDVRAAVDEWFAGREGTETAAGATEGRR